MAERFNSLTGGLVDTIVAGLGDSISTNIQNVGTGEGSFSINSILGGVVEDASGYALNAGQNYLTSQLGASLGNSINNALLNAVTTQIATAGINQAINFVTQTIPNPFTGGSNVTTAGLAGQASRSTISIPDSVASKLEQADYGGSAYTLNDIVFTLVPANAGSQTQVQPQTAPIADLGVAFSPNANFSPKALDAIKSQTAYQLPAQGRTFGNFGQEGFYKPSTTATLNTIKQVW